MADVQSPASPTSPTPSAPTHNRAKTIFQPSFNWRRLSLSVHSGGASGLTNSNMTAAGVKLRNLQDLTIFELLDTLKSLNCPLKARKCLQTVGVNGRDFEYYTDRDLEQIGVSRPDIRKKVLEIKKQILDHGSKIPETLLTPKSKWERLENKGEDPFMGVPDGGFGASNNGGLTKSNDERFTTQRASTVHTLFPSKDDTLKGISPNSPKMGSGSLTPQEKHIIKSDLVSTMEKVGEQLVRMERRSMGKEPTELPIELPKL